MSDKKRKLVAIVYTDIAGFSALSASDENRAIELVNVQRELIQPIIDSYAGTLHKEIGDGFLLTFPTVTAAVEFGIDFQRAIKQYDELKIRIGIHEGEVTVQENDVFGDDVNVGARIEPYSPVGGIAISEKVKLEIGSLPEYQTEYIGEPELKGISQPIKIYCISSHGLPSPKKSVRKGSVTDRRGKFNFNILSITGILLAVVGCAFWTWYALGGFSQGSEMDNKIFKSIAILYLENQSNDLKDENICAALTTSITTAFSRLGRFKVKARTDVLKFKNKIKSHKEIHETLGVDAYIEGSLYRVPGNNKYIANITLIDAEKGNNIWAKEYTKTPEEISNISNTIASEVAQFLSGDGVRDFEVLNDLADINDSDESFSLMGEGINLLDSKKYDQSIHVFDSILVKEPHNNRAVYSKGKALEGLGQYSDAINSYNQILTKVNPAARAKNIWSHPDILKYGPNKINVMDDTKISAELNIQVMAIFKKDSKISEISAIDLSTHDVVWERTYPFSVKIEIVGSNLVIARQTILNRDDNEAAVYVHSLKYGTLLFSKEFSKDHPEQKILIRILSNYGDDLTLFKDAVFLYIRRDGADYSLVIIDPKSNQIILDSVVSMPEALEGDPQVYLVEEGGKQYLLHKKGINLYLFEIDGGNLIWNRALPDNSYEIKVFDNVMWVGSKNETGVVLHNILSQKQIGEFEMDSAPSGGYQFNENILIKSKNSITSIKTYKPFLRSIENWTQYIDENDEIKWFDYVYDNLFVVTKSNDLYCINGKTGEIINKNQIGHHIDFLRYPEGDSDGNSPKSVILYAGGFLFGLDPHNGKTLWKIRELNIITEKDEDENEGWRVWGRIVPIGNKVVVLKRLESENYIILKAYNRMTGELLWISREDIFQDITKIKYGGQKKINNQIWGYAHNNTLYLKSSPGGFIYSVDISWKPNKNYVSKANLYKSLAYCYNKINNQEKASELLEKIINIVDQQNEEAFQQLSNIYLTNNDYANYIKSQIGFHELVFYDEIKRGNIENQLMQTGGLKWVQHFKREHDFAVHFPDNNIIVAGLCNDGGGCTLKYYRTGSGIPIGENNLDLDRCSNVVALNNKLLFIGEKEREDGGQISSLFEIDPNNRVVINKVFLGDGYYFTNYIYHFGGLYIVDSDHAKIAQHGKSRYLIAVDMDNGDVVWKNKYEYTLLSNHNHLRLINKDGLIVIPLSEQFQAINLFSGKLDWMYEFDEFEDIKYIDQESLNGDNLFFITLDDEFVGFNLTNREIIFLSDEISFDYRFNVSFLNHNNMLAFTHDGKVAFFENNGTDMVQRWIEDFKHPIRILDVIDNTVYIQSLEDAVITTIHLENPKNKHVSYLMWNINKIFINNDSYVIYNNKNLYLMKI